ncbi:radial spoke head protein 6 homolog A [Aricia agestis]|uniref:radial spoke head protein 6 homolog A n=1 Tax=Aricia agestis TaxID=91739 RepID=UPI001C207CCC|nr:radial spoke head protein 6 homolog A [Aricia agestis]
MDFMNEPDIIAANENVMPDINNDLILAKNFLKKQSASTGDTLYDHLVDMVHRLLTEQPPNVVDYLEQFSWDVKKDKLRPNFDSLKDVYKSPSQLAAVRKVNEMFKIVRNSNKTETQDEDEEEPVLDLEEEADKPKIADLIEHNHNFRQCGFGLPEHECFAVYIALNMLAIKEPVASVRFFGKIFGTKKNYYIAETELNEEELEKQIKEFEDKENPEEESEEEAPEIADENKQMLEEEERAKPKDLRPKLPPVPTPTHVPPPRIPPERPGQGVNKKVFYACNSPGDEWVRLPDVTPDQIRVARQTIRCMTGDLDAEVISFPVFSGCERNFLRAQLARVQAATAVSPHGFYTFGSGEEEEDIDMAEDMGDLEFNPNAFYEGHTLRDLADPALTSWVHHGRHILQQGRTIWWNTRADAEENGEEEEDEIPTVEPERGPPLFTSLAEDDPVCGARAWAVRTSSTLVRARALVAVRSIVWPGAFAYATTGKMSECMYVGWGVKQGAGYAPPPLPAPRDEYPPGPEVMEMPDPTVDEEEAYRIAHLPPQPLSAEGEEGESTEEEEEED